MWPASRRLLGKVWWCWSQCFCEVFVRVFGMCLYSTSAAEVRAGGRQMVEFGVLDSVLCRVVLGKAMDITRMNGLVIMGQIEKRRRRKHAFSISSLGARDST